MKENTEKWKPIPDFPDYEISNMGRVRSFKRGSIRILKNMTNRRGGYAFVGLYNATAEGSKRTLINVHNLVAAAFLGPRPKGMVIDHKNRDRTDARVSNLQYITLEENSRRILRI